MISKKTARVLEFNIILERLAAKAVSYAGRNAALALMPQTDKEKVLRLMEETCEGETVLLGKTNYPLMSFDDITAELKRTKTGASLNTAELLRVNTVFKAAKKAKDSLAHEENITHLKNMAQNLYYDARVMNDIERCIVAENEISDAASPELYNIRRKIKKENEFIREKLSSVIRGKGFADKLQDAIITQRNGRYVVPVKQEYKNSIPGMVHDQSASGATVFIEPAAVVEANNRISELKSAQKAEEERILAFLTAMVKPLIGDLKNDISLLGEIDLIFAKASLGLEMKAVPVTFTDEYMFDIKEGRHPLIDKNKVIPLSIKMEQNIKGLIITGPNTGGKTVTLKMCGLFALMAQSGMFLPARSDVTMPIFDGVFADIGDEQSIEQSLSTFSSHMKNTIYILRNAGKRSLVLLDEIGAGTEPQEGVAIALAVLSHLEKKGSMIIATTHYSEIKAFAMNREGFENASMEFDTVALMPTYKLLIGVPGMSNALLISKRLGLPKDVLDSAYDFLSKEHTEFVSLIENAQSTRQKAEKELAKAERFKEETAVERNRIKQKEATLDEKYKKIIDDARKKALEIVSDAKEESEEMIELAKKLAKQGEADRTKTTDKIRKTLSDKKDTLVSSINKSKRRHKQMKPRDIKVGDTVKIVSMDVLATVLKEPNAKGQVQLQAGIMKVNIHISDLEPAQEEKKKEVMRTKSVTLQRKMISPQIDLHGMAVDDAILEVDRYLDDAFVAGLHEVTIIHGLGTGVLKKGIRNYLRTHPHVKEQRPGQYGEGSDGVTVVTLK